MKTKLHLIKKMKLSIIAVLLFMATSTIAQVTISPWKMNPGNGIIPFNVGFNGNPTAYSKINIPTASDSNWTAAPVDANGAINFSVNSILSQCLSQIDFTYFETYLNIPANFNVSDLNISFTAADDGARAYIFNSAHPNGAFIGQIILGQAPVTANYASLAVPGEINRLVIAQFDSCPSGNNLTGAQVKVNGQTAEINTSGCAQSNFFWSDAPKTSFLSKKATGTINGIGYTYTSSDLIRTTPNLFSHATFPASYNVPDNNPTIKNINSSSNTLTFNSPMTNPVLVFSSIGQYGLSVPIQFSNDIEVLWSTGITINSSTRITGTEGYAIVRMNGTFSSLSFDYLANEDYVNFVFGADFIEYTPDTEAPTVTLNGNATDSVNAFTSYTDPGASVTDNCDNNPAVLVSGSVDTNVPGDYTLTYTAVDASGNTSTPLSRVVNVVDATPPTIITQDITINLDANGNASITPAQIDNGSNDASGNVTLSLDKTNFDCSNLGMNTVNLTVTDTNGNNISAPAIVTIVDTISPGNGGSSVTFAAPSTIINNVPEATNYEMVYELNIPNNANWDTQTQVPYSVNNLTALNGISYDRIAYYMQLDNQWVWVSLDSFTNIMSETGIPTEATFTGNVSNLNIFSNVPGITNGTGITTGNIEFWSNCYGTNNQNNISGASNATYDFGDEIGTNSIDCYGSFQIHNYAAGETLFAYNRWTENNNNGDVGIGNAPSGNPDWTFYGNAPSYSIKKIYVFVRNENTSGGGNLNTNDITVELDENGQITINALDIDGGNIDNCAIASRSLDKNTFDCSNLGSNEVVFTITDTSGNSSTATAIVTVKDSIAPIVQGQDISVTLTANGTVSIVANDVLVSGSDNCGPVTYTINQNIFTATDAINSPVTVQLTATDESGNSTTVPVLVTVIDPVPVVITQDIILELDTNGNVTITPNQIDNGSTSLVGIANLELDNTTFNCSNIGVPVTVTLTATSTLGSTATGTATVTILDTTAPNVITQNIVVQLDENGNASITPEMINNGSTDNCGIEELSLNITNFTCNNLGDNQVILTVKDGSGNVSNNTANVIVEDTIAPTIALQDIIVPLNENGIANFTVDMINNGTTDNCAIASLELSETSFACSNLGENTIVFTATDVNGNVSTENVIVTVIDEIAPTVITKNIEVYLDANGNASITPEMVDNGSFDNCTFSLSLNTTTFSCNTIGDNIVSLIAIDASGLQSTQQATVTVIDTILPTAVSQDITVQLDKNGNASITPEMINNGSSDNCTFTTSLDVLDFTCANVGENIITLTVRDASGNTATSSSTVTVVDSVPAEVITQNINVYLDENGTASIVVEDINNGSNDACGIESLTLDVTNFSCDNLGENTVTLTATDVNGNVSSKEAIVTVIDNIAPIVGTQNITVELDANGNASIAPEDVLVVTEDDIVRGDICKVSDAEAHAMYLKDYNKYNYSHWQKNTSTSKKGDKGKNKNDDDDDDDNHYHGYRYNQKDARFIFDQNQGSIIKNLDGSAVITGTLVNSKDSNDKWNVTLNLINPKDWNDWNNLRRKWKGSKKTIGNSYKDWTYYELAEGSKLVGAGSNSGLETPITQQYEKYGFQIGDNANLENGNYGLSGSFYYTTKKGKKSKGEFNFDISDCIKLPLPERTVFTSDNCSIESYSLDISNFTCDNIGDNIVQISVTDQSGNTTIKPVTITVLGDTPSVTIEDFYTAKYQKANTIYLGYSDTTRLKAVATGGSGFSYQWYNEQGELFSTEQSPYVSPEVTTTYTVVVTNSNGCQDTTSTEVCVIDARAKDKHGRFNDKVIICHHTSGYYHHKGSSNGKDKDKDKERNKHVLIEVSKNAVYAHLKHGDVLGGCEAVCITEVYVEPELVTDVNIYPNPSTGYFKVQLDNFDNNVVVMLYSLQGRLLQYKIVKDCKRESSVTIGSRFLREGIYVVKIKSGGEIYTGRVLIDRSKQ